MYVCAQIVTIMKTIYLLIISIFLLGTESYAQNCSDLKVEFEMNPTVCLPNGNVAVVVSFVSSGTIDISGVKLRIYKGGSLIVQSPTGNNVLNNVPPGGPYNIYVEGVKCNGTAVTIDPIEGLTVSTGLKGKASFIRCSSQDIFVTSKASGGIGPYRYEIIDNGVIIASVPNVPSGTEASVAATTTSNNIQVRLVDDGCALNAPVTINATPNVDYSTLTSVLDGNKEACVGDAISLSLKSEFQGTSYKWEKNGTVVSTTSAFSIANSSVADAGIYTFSMILNSCGNVYTEAVNVNIGSATAPSVSVVNVCLNSAQFPLSNFVSPSAGFALEWYNTNGSLIGSTAPVFNPNIAGTYKYYVSQKNAMGCESAKAELQIVVNNPPAAISSNNIIFCNDPSNPDPKMIVVNAGNYTYNLYDSYSGSNKIGTGIAVNDTAYITGQSLVIGQNYYLETEDSNGCTSTSRATIPVNVKSTLILGPNKLCFGDNMILTADYPGGQITWTLPDGSTYLGKTLTTNNVDFTASGTYSVTIVEAGLGCTMTDHINVAVNRPSAPVVVDTLYRYYQTQSALPLKATANNGLVLKWYAPNGSVIMSSGQPEQLPVPPTNALGTFVYQVSQDSLGCESEKIIVTVIVGSIPSPVDASDINICIADKPLIQIDNTINNYTYTVMHKGAKIAEGTGNGGLITLVSSVSMTENTVFEITVTDTFGVTSNKTNKAVIAANNITDIQSTLSICDGSQGTLIAVNIPNATYVWTTPGGTNVNAQSITISNAGSADAGNYTLTVNINQCPNPAIQITNVNVGKPQTPITSGNVYYCENDNATALTAIPQAGFSLIWFDAMGANLPSAPVPPTNAAGTFTYFVAQVSLSDANCVSDKEQIDVIVDTRPNAVTLGQYNICSGKTVSLTINNTINGYTYGVYSQTTGNDMLGEVIGDGLAANIPLSIVLNADTTFYLQVKNTAGCASERTPIDISVVELYIQPGELPSYQVDEYYSQAFQTNASNPSYSIISGFLPAGFIISSNGIISGTGSFADPSVFTVEVSNDMGCTVSREYTLKSEMLVSNMFSPNGDGINDVFMKGYKVIIFDRLGRRLFEGKDGWDGTHKGKVMPEDAYYYILYHSDKDGKEKRITGHVTLLK